MKRWIEFGLLLALSSMLFTAQAQTPASCPPQAQLPTPQQLQAAASNARDRGLLWRLTRDGRTAYLYGSIHVGKLEWAFPGPQMHAALAASDTVALEIDVGDPQMAALIPREAAATQRLVGQMLAQLEQGSAQRVLARLAAAWERGDLAELADYARWCDCAVSDDDRALMQRLNDERNPALADAIEAQHRHGRKLFAAVGALHMTGPKALPALLAQRGFKVERVALQ